MLSSFLYLKDQKVPSPCEMTTLTNATQYQSQQQPLTDNLPELRACAVWQLKRHLLCTDQRALEIERALFAITTRDFDAIPSAFLWDHEPVRKAYRTKLFSTLSNIMSSSSNMKDVLASATTQDALEQIFLQDPRDFSPSLWKNLVQKRYAQQQENEKEQEPLRLESQIECNRCKRANKYFKNVETTQVQTRSADEPMTVFCVCRTCGQRWRM